MRVSAMRSILFLAISAILLLALSGTCTAYTPGDPEWRGIFVGRGTVTTAEKIDALLAAARACNANAVVPEFRAVGTTNYPSPYEPTYSGVPAGFDPLAYLIEKAHTGSPRIEVHVWMWMWNMGYPAPSNPNHPLNLHPDWISYDDLGNITNDAVGGYVRFDPGNPDVAEYTYNVVMDMVSRYDIDGLNLDNIRYGEPHLGYNPVSVARFNTAYGRTGQPAYNDPDWCDWRRQQVTNFVRRVYADTTAAKPSVKVSADCTTGGSVPATDADFASTSAYSRVFQNWMAWMQEGILDMSMPMAYLQCGTPAFDNWTCFTRSHQYNRQCAMIAASYINTPECLASQLQAVRDLSCSGAPGSGASIFSYSSLDASFYDAIRTMWTSPVSVPDMPWKSAPTTGHAKGKVTFGGNTWVDRAQISLSGMAVSRTIAADGNGCYAFIDVPPGGGYNLTCNAPGYGLLTATASVVAGQFAQVNFDYPISQLALSDVQCTAVTDHSATITWSTSAASTSRVDYGPERDCALSTGEDTSTTVRHRVIVEGLSSLTPYHFRVYSKHPLLPAVMSDVEILITSASTPEIIIDNPSAAFTGSWTYGTMATQKYGDDYRWCGFSPLMTATYSPTLPTASDYKVSEWHSEGTNRCSQVPYTVSYNGGSETFYISQRANGGKWNEMCARPFAAGTSGGVQITNQVISPEGSVVIADAIKFTAVLESVLPTTATGLHATDIGSSYVSLAWNASTDNVGIGGYRIFRDWKWIDASPSSSHTDTTALSNTRYWYWVSAYDTAGNSGGTSPSLMVCTLPATPTSATVVCDKPAGVWQTSGPFAFSAAGGFGPGRIAFYRYVWDNSPTHAWTNTESLWTSGAIWCGAAPNPLGYYLHIRGYNQDGAPGEAADLGPYLMAQAVSSVAEARSSANVPVAIQQAVVSAVFADCFYVQDISRAGGIRVEGLCAFAEGTEVTVAGVLGRNAANERTITEPSVTPAPPGP